MTATISIQGTPIQFLPRVEGFKALGVRITFDNKFDVELNARFRAARATFHKFAPILECKAISLEKRLAVLKRTVCPALFWCSGSWNLRKDQCAKLRGLQFSMVRKMIGPSRGDSESLEDFMIRTNSKIKHLLCHHDIDRWDYVSHRNVFKWGGWLARLSVHDPNRLTYRVFRHKDWNWIQLSVAAFNKGRQLHCRRLHTWRWERPIFKALGLDWHSLAADKEEWEAQLDSLASWRCLHR